MLLLEALLEFFQDHLDVLRLLDSHGHGIALRVPVPAEIEQAQVDVGAQNGLDEAGCLQFGSVVGVEVNQAFFGVVHLGAVEGGAKPIIAVISDGEINPDSHVRFRE
jgi:hypothetical protein